MLSGKLKIEDEIWVHQRQMLMRMISHGISQHLDEFPKRCYLKPAKINGHPVGYCGAMTFKIINVKRRSK